MSTQPTDKSSKGKPLSLGVIFLTIFIDLVGFSIIFPLFPSILEHYAQDGLLLSLTEKLNQIAIDAGAGERFTPVLFGGALGSLYAALQFFFAPLWGSLSDKHGRRPILLITTIGTGLSYVLWTFAGSFGLLVAARILGGAMSGNLSVATAAVADVTTEENRSKGMGMVGAAFGLGFVIGPAIGGLCSMYNPLIANPQLADYGINPFTLVALVAATLSFINIFWIRARFVESLPAANEAHEAPRKANPFSRLLATQTPPVRKTNFTYFIYILAFSGMEFTLTFLGVDRFGFDIKQTTMMMIYIGFVLIITQGGIVRRMAPKMGEKKTALYGLVLVSAGLAVLAIASTVTLLYVGLGIMALGAGLCSPTLTALVSLYSNKDDQGKSLGAFRSIGSLGRAVAPIIAGYIFWRLGADTLYFAGAALVFISALLCARLPKTAKS